MLRQPRKPCFLNSVAEFSNLLRSFGSSIKALWSSANETPIKATHTWKVLDDLRGISPEVGIHRVWWHPFRNFAPENINPDISSYIHQTVVPPWDLSLDTLGRAPSLLTFLQPSSFFMLYSLFPRITKASNVQGKGGWELVINEERSQGGGHSIVKHTGGLKIWAKNPKIFIENSNII